MPSLPGKAPGPGLGRAIPLHSSSEMLAQRSCLCYISPPVLSVGSRLDIPTTAGSDASCAARKCSPQHAVQIALQEGCGASEAMYSDQG